MQRQPSDHPEAVRKRLQRQRQRNPRHKKLDRKPCLVDVGSDVFNTLEYLKRIDGRTDKEGQRAELSRALSEWAAANNPFLV